MSETKQRRHDDDSNVTWAIGVVQGRVELQYLEGPRSRVVMDSENARQIAEGIAKAAYEARHGRKPDESKSNLAEAIRERMINRVAIVAGSLAEQGKSNREIAQTVVDIVMSELA
jgi:hypothetical protein